MPEFKLEIIIAADSLDHAEELRDELVSTAQDWWDSFREARADVGDLEEA